MTEDTDKAIALMQVHMTEDRKAHADLERAIGKMEGKLDHIAEQVNVLRIDTAVQEQKIKANAARGGAVAGGIVAVPVTFVVELLKKFIGGMG